MESGNSNIRFSRTEMFRVIPRLDIKNNNVINTVGLEGLRTVGEPMDLATHYYSTGADEIILNDLVASLYQRNNLSDLVSEVCTHVFVPITVVGGVRSIQDAEKLFKLGADKIGVNTAAVNNPTLINDLTKEFGSQSIIGSIDTRPVDGKYMIFTDGGRELHSVDPIDWANELISRGIGEILFTSINKDGRLTGLDEELLWKIQEIKSIPTIISGGVGGFTDFETAYKKHQSGVAAAGAFHTNLFTPIDIKKAISAKYGDDYLNV